MFLISSTSRERFKAHESGKLQFSCTEIYDFTSDDLVDLGEIGRGAFGSVNKMIFKKTDKIMAVKVSQMFFALHYHLPLSRHIINFISSFREFDARVSLTRKSRNVLWI